MTSAAPGTHHLDARPPIAIGAAPPPGAAERHLRPTARRRTSIRPALVNDPHATLGYPPDHPYVRRYWTAALGAGAVTDLLRLIAAARSGSVIPRPLHLSALARQGLVTGAEGGVAVRPTVPPLPEPLARRLLPALRTEHARLRWEVAHRRTL